MVILQTFLGNCLVVGIYKYKLHGVIIMNELTMKEMESVGGGGFGATLAVVGLVCATIGHFVARRAVAAVVARVSLGAAVGGAAMSARERNTPR